MSDRLGHELIRASAGSGKTYKLTLRYLRILALGEDPRRMIALTFTRKAAGEFLHRILGKLTEAAGSEKGASQLSVELDMLQLNQKDYLKLLNDFIRSLGELNLSTIDSFLNQMVSAFAVEIGLPGSYELMDDYYQDQQLENCLNQLLNELNETESDALLDSFKLATWGVEQKSVLATLRELFTRFHRLYQLQPDAEAWGDNYLKRSQSVWWRSGKHGEIKAIVIEIRKLFSLEESLEKLSKSFMALLDGFEGWYPGKDFKGTVFDQIMDSLDDLRVGRLSISFFRTNYDFPSTLCQKIYELLQLWISAEIGSAVVKTRAFYQLISRYERIYDDAVRSNGRLVFSDLTYLLWDGSNAGRGLIDEVKVDRLFYRMDQHFDHWLLDEFQDTSREQWKVVERFADEVLQDPSGRRSFFYVGDTKQSIYRWRGGDDRLFDEIYNRYSQGEAGIAEIPLNVSWRSSPVVLEAVNKVFGNSNFFLQHGGASGVRWNKYWKAHEAAKPNSSLPGYVLWKEVGKENAYEEAAQIIKSVNPIDKGLSCAILLRKTDQVEAMREVLIQHQIPCAIEGSIFITRDNDLGNWLRAILHCIAAPYDYRSFSRAFVRSLPFYDCIDSLDTFLESCEASVSECGIAMTMRWILLKVDSVIQTQPIWVTRSRQIMDQVVQFSKQGEVDLERFIRFFEQLSLNEFSRFGQIQVMTVHKSKGLDFDMVILPKIDQEELIKSRSGELKARDGIDGLPEWILNLPRKKVIEADPVLQAAQIEWDTEAFYESLCLLYVAMTRAKQALYFVSVPPPKQSSCLRNYDLIDSSLTEVADEPKNGIRYKAGDENWYNNIEGLKTNDYSRPTIEFRSLSVDMKRMQKTVSPSRQKRLRELPSDWISVLGASTFSAQLGTDVHEGLSKIDFLPINEAWMKSCRLAESIKLVNQFLTSKAGELVFKQPNGPFMLYKEQPYLIEDHGEYSEGMMDRMVLHLDDLKNVVKAEIFDFKTDQLNGPESVLKKKSDYQPQMEAYRIAVSKLYGVSLSMIAVKLVFIRTGQIIEL